MSKCHNIISFGKLNVKLFILIIIGTTVYAFLDNLKSSLIMSDENKHPIIFTICLSLAKSFFFILLILYVKFSRNKASDINFSITDKKSNKTIVSKREKFLWIFLVSVIGFVTTILYTIFCFEGNYLNDINTWLFDILFLSLFSRLLLNLRLYKHHYLSIIIIGTFSFFDLTFDIIYYKGNALKSIMNYLTHILFNLTYVLYKYFMLVNGCKMKCYKIEGGSAVPFANLLTYTDMLFEKNEVKEVIKPFERLEYDEYFDVDRIKSYPWAYSKIGEDTPDSLIPYIINIDDCLLDSSIRLTEIHSDDFSFVSDLGTQLRQYDDSSGGGFGTGVYRSFIVEDKRYHSNFLIGFSIIATAKTVNDSVYGNTDGKSVLVVMVNDGDTDEMSVQINLNRYMKVVDKNRVRIIHNGAVTRKGASKKDLFDYISGYTQQLVDGASVVTGELDCNVLLTMDNDDMKEFLSRLIEYSVYRNEYKKSLSGRKR